MTIKQLYPTQRPALDLNFARQKRLDPRVTFTRGSTATYVGSDGLIKTAASGEARFDHDPETGESLGLLVEESRTNLLIHSEEFDNAAWIKLGTTVSANTTTAPNGTATADKLVSNNATNRFCAYRYLTMTANSVQTLSCYGKSAGWNFMTLVVGKQGSPYTRDSYTINLNDGTVNKGPWTSNSVLFTAVTKEKLANGWWKLSVSVKVDASSTDLHVEIGASPTNQYNNGMTGDGTSGIYIWGAQLEAASFPTSYIPTTTVTVTRSADVASMTGTNFSSWYNQGEGSLVVSADRVDGLPSLQFTVLTTNGYRNPEFTFRSDGRASIYNPTVGSYLTSAALQKATFGWSFDGTGASRAINGVGNSVANTGINDTNTTLSIGNYGGSNNYRHNGHISRLAYYPTRLSDTQLQALTL